MATLVTSGRIIGRVPKATGIINVSVESLNLITYVVTHSQPGLTSSKILSSDNNVPIVT